MEDLVPTDGCNFAKGVSETWTLHKSYCRKNSKPETLTNLKPYLHLPADGARHPAGRVDLDHLDEVHHEREPAARRCDGEVRALAEFEAARARRTLIECQPVTTISFSALGKSKVVLDLDHLTGIDDESEPAARCGDREVGALA